MSCETNTKIIESKYEDYGSLLQHPDCILWLEFERRFGYSPSYHSNEGDAKIKDRLLELYGKKLQEDPEITWVPRLVNPLKKPVPLPKDYCQVGQSNCFCGWRGEYPVSGCPLCHRSFCD